MRLAYFPKNPQEESLFAREFARQGIHFEVFHPTDVWLSYHVALSAGVGPQLSLQDLTNHRQCNEPLSEFDLIFQRSVSSWNQIYSPEIVMFFFEVLFLAERDANIINRPTPTLLARRKHVSLSLLARKGIPVLPFFASPSPIRNMKITKQMPPPTIVKTLEGGGGLGVLSAPDETVLGDILSLFHRNLQVPILQPYIEADHDLRLFVLGDEVIGSIRREGQIYKHNVSLGARSTYIPSSDLPKELLETAVRASQQLGLHIAGVDLLETPQGPAILEVNPSPGFAGLSSASGLNIQKKIVAYLASAPSS